MKNWGNWQFYIGPLNFPSCSHSIGNIWLSICRCCSIPSCLMRSVKSIGPYTIPIVNYVLHPCPLTAAKLPVGHAEAIRAVRWCVPPKQIRESGYKLASPASSEETVDRDSTTTSVLFPSLSHSIWVAEASGRRLTTNRIVVVLCLVCKQIQ